MKLDLSLKHSRRRGPVLVITGPGGEQQVVQVPMPRREPQRPTHMQPTAPRPGRGGHRARR